MKWTERYVRNVQTSLLRPCHHGPAAQGIGSWLNVPTGMVQSGYAATWSMPLMFWS